MKCFLRNIGASLLALPALAMACNNTATFYSDLNDTWVPGGNPALAVMKVSRDPNIDYRAIMPFSTFALPSWAVVCYAELQIKSVTSATVKPILAGQVDLGQFVIPPYATAPIDLFPGFHIYDVTPIVTAWPGTLLHIEGIGLREDTNTGAFLERVNSRNAINPANRPVLTVYY